VAVGIVVAAKVLRSDAPAGEAVSAQPALDAA
jgi:hypothetical protein